MADSANLWSIPLTLSEFREIGHTEFSQNLGESARGIDQIKICAFSRLSDIYDKIISAVKEYIQKCCIKQEYSFKKYFNPLISQQHLKSQWITELHKKRKK